MKCRNFYFSSCLDVCKIVSSQSLSEVLNGE